MRWSKYFIPTLKEVPSEAEAISHRLMIRSGLIRKLASGAYTYLPLGLRVLKKVEDIIRQEMDKKGAIEVFLPSLQPIELWQESGRFKDLGEDLIKFKDRHNRIMVFGPTHEEVITDLVRNHIHSYKQLPVTFYQIQTKFRDEVRPRFGVIRSREFIMKDAYSFDRDNKAMDESYKKMYDAYEAIFKRCGLNVIAVEADSGVMGGDISHEFMVLSENGEDVLGHCVSCGYAASISVAECISKPAGKTQPLHGLKPLAEVDTPGVSSIDKVGTFLKVRPINMVKTLIYLADEKSIAVLIRGDHEANEVKIKRYLKCNSLVMAPPDIIEKITGAPLGFSGPVGIKDTRIIADNAIRDMSNFVTGANKKDRHLINVNIDRDFKIEEWSDLRLVTDSDECPKCGKNIRIEHAIEMGHVFKLGLKYSKAMKAEFLDDDGKLKPIVMGCYGIGVNRIIAAAIELFNDEKGIKWPLSIAPFQVLIVAINYKEEHIRKEADSIYNELIKLEIEVLLDDRDESAGIKFNDAELIGIPIIIVVGEKAVKKHSFEVKIRSSGEVQEVKKSEIKHKIPALVQYLTKPNV